MDSSIDKLERFAEAYLDDDQVEHLVGWLASRHGRQKALAGPSREARWRRALEWCSPEQRLALLVWLERRRTQATGYSPR